MHFVLLSYALVIQHFCLGCRFVQSLTLAPVYWNSTNHVFKSSKNSHLIEVNLNDEIDFVCPFYEDLKKETHVEYYIVYQVKERSYKSCYIGDSEPPIVILNCSNPLQKKRFTLLFESFQAIPNVPEFVPGGKYYFITTSTGQYDGLTNSHLGACQSHHMKLIISVCCQSYTPGHRVHHPPHVPPHTATHSRHTKYQTQKSSTSNKFHHIQWKKRNRNLVTPLVPKHDLLSSLTSESQGNRHANYILPAITLFAFSLLFNR